MKTRVVNKCGECNACCKRFNILDAFWTSDGTKPPNTLCEKWCGGCTIYDERPKSCIDYECLWLRIKDAREDFPTSLRPDNVGGMLSSRLSNGEGQVLIEEIEPESFDPMNMTPEQQQLVDEVMAIMSKQDVPSGLYLRSYVWNISKVNFSTEDK